MEPYSEQEPESKVEILHRPGVRGQQVPIKSGVLQATWPYSIEVHTLNCRNDVKHHPEDAETRFWRVEAVYLVQFLDMLPHLSRSIGLWLQCINHLDYHGTTLFLVIHEAPRPGHVPAYQ